MKLTDYISKNQEVASENQWQTKNVVEEALIKLSYLQNIKLFSSFFLSLMLLSLFFFFFFRILS